MPLVENECQRPARRRMLPRKHALAQLPLLESLSRRSRLTKKWNAPSCVLLLAASPAWIHVSIRYPLAACCRRGAALRSGPFSFPRTSKRPFLRHDPHRSSRQRRNPYLLKSSMYSLKIKSRFLRFPVASIRTPCATISAINAEAVFVVAPMISAAEFTSTTGWP